MTKHLQLLLSIYLLWLSQAIAALVISEHQDLLTAIKDSSLSLEAAHERLALSYAQEKVFFSDFSPILAINSEYLDDNSVGQNLINQTITSNLTASYLQKLLFGAEIGIGVSHKHVKVKGSNSFYNPAGFINLEVNLSNNIFGARDKLLLNNYAFDAGVARIAYSRELTNIYYQAIAIFWDIQILTEIIAEINVYLTQLKKLEDDTIDRVARGVAEKGELYSLRANIAAKTAEVLAMGRNIQNANIALAKILSTQQQIKMNPTVTSSDIKDKLLLAEQQILNTKNTIVNTSEEYQQAQVKIQQAHNNRKVTELNTLPNIALYANYTSTGKNVAVDNSYREIGKFQYPKYSLGLKLNIPLSINNYRTKYQAAALQEQLAIVSQKQQTNNLLLKYQDLITIIQQLQYEASQTSIAITNSNLLLEDLYVRYEQGRISLLELINQEGRALEIRVQNKKLFLDRIRTVAMFYQTFNHVDHNNFFRQRL